MICSATSEELLVRRSAQRQPGLAVLSRGRGLFEGGDEPLPVSAGVAPGHKAAVELSAGEAEEAAVLAVVEAEALLQLREDGLHPGVLAGERRDEEAGEAPDRVRDRVGAAPREVRQEGREYPVLKR